MTHPPRCTRCGRVPPIRRLDGPGLDIITWECRDCGARNELRVARLARAERPELTGDADAA